MPLPKDATEREKILRERDEAARYIEDSVGFSPQEIQDYQDELREIMRVNTRHLLGLTW